MRSSFVLPLMFVTALGCSASSGPEGTAPSQAAEGTQPEGRPTGHKHGVTVMTRNVYFGFDETPLIGASGEQIPGLVAQMWAQMMANDFTVRGAAIADEIAGKLPAVVGLQEMADYVRYFHDGSPPLDIDFVTILQQALTARGLDYEVAVVQNDSTLTAPLLAGFDGGQPVLDYVQFTDREVILARGDVTISSPQSNRYTAAVVVPIGGVDVEEVRSWASVVVTTPDSEVFRFVSTHLEVQAGAVIQEAQAGELLDLLSTESLPLIVVGDFNSAADGSQTPTYGTIASAGYVDAWAQANPHDPGYSCCEPVDLLGPATFDQRIDIVWVRECNASGRIRGHVEACLVGNVAPPQGEIWPSDHAGVVVSLRILPASH